MAELVLPPVPTQATVDQAFSDKLNATATALGITSALTLGNYIFNAPGGPKVQTALKIALTGIDVKAGGAGRAVIKVPTVTLFVAALPQPVGYVPAELYNLHPEVYKQLLGFPVGSKPPFFSASEARLEVFAAREAAADIGKRALQVERFNYAPTFLDRTMIPPGPINITPAELAFLEALPPGLSAAQDLIPQLEARRADLRQTTQVVPPSILYAVRGPQGLELVTGQVVNGQVLPGSIQVELVKPVNEKSIENQLRAVGIRILLVSERVDP